MVVWRNSFDGSPLTPVTVANSAQHGDPIAGLRNDPPAGAVRYGDQAALGASSLMLGTDDGSAHGDVWLYYPTGEQYSISFYLYLTPGTWFRVRDSSIITEFYMATESGQYLLGNHAIPTDTAAEFVGRWMRAEISCTTERMAYRLYWADPHTPDGEPDYEYSEQRAGGTLGDLFTQGGGGPSPYMDQVRISGGEWLGPWPTHSTTSASATLPLVGTAEATAEHEDRVTARGTLSLSGTASATRNGTTSARASSALRATAAARRDTTTSARGALPLTGSAEALRHTTTSAAGRMVLRSRAVPRSNASLALDYSAGHVSPPFEPTDDDDGLVNTVEATRRDGGEAAYRLDEGPLGAAPPPEGVGPYEESVTLDVARDEQLGEQAGWRVHLGTADGYRYPSATVNLVGNPQLVETVAERDTGDALQIINPPAWLPPEPVELMIEGYTETLNAYRWSIEFNASPGAPWIVGQALAEEDGEPVALGESQPNRADTAGCGLAEDLDETATGFTVTTHQGPRWITSEEFPDELPFDIQCGGEVMRVQSITGTGRTQTFTVIRAMNTIRQPHPAGEPVTLVQPAVVAL